MTIRIRIAFGTAAIAALLVATACSRATPAAQRSSIGPPADGDRAYTSVPLTAQVQAFTARVEVSEPLYLTVTSNAGAGMCTANAFSRNSPAEIAASAVHEGQAALIAAGMLLRIDPAYVAGGTIADAAGVPVITDDGHIGELCRADFDKVVVVPPARQ